jgi:glycosyltransferase involved in cell wall biosynthesis
MKDLILSVVIITKNEAHHISRCLESVQWADEIIILDSGSEDDTLKLCNKFTDKIYSTDWPGFGIQKQRAVEKAKAEWILSIDADESVSSELREEIQQTIQSTQFNGFEIPRLSSYCGKQIHHGGWWPDYTLRLFRKGYGKFSESIVHEKIELKGKTGRLESPLRHETYINLEEVINKINSYSSLSAKMMYEKRTKSSLGEAISRATWTFFRTYLLRAAFLDGREGLMLSISNAETAYYKYLKLFELYQKRNIN